MTLLCSSPAGVLVTGKRWASLVYLETSLRTGLHICYLLLGEQLFKSSLELSGHYRGTGGWLLFHSLRSSSKAHKDSGHIYIPS